MQIIDDEKAAGWYKCKVKSGECQHENFLTTAATAGEIYSDLYRTQKMNSDLIWRNTFIIVGDSSWYTTPIHETNQGNA